VSINYVDRSNVGPTR